jgi:hypothetical protein
MIKMKVLKMLMWNRCARYVGKKTGDMEETVTQNQVSYVFDAAVYIELVKMRIGAPFAKTNKKYKAPAITFFAAVYNW